MNTIMCIFYISSPLVFLFINYITKLVVYATSEVLLVYLRFHLKMKIHNIMGDSDVLITMIARLTKEITGLITEQLKESKADLTKSQAIVLSKLVCREGCAQHDLALITARDKTSLTRLLSTMERKGLILRKKSKHDRRIKEVSITEFGKEQFEIARPIIRKIFYQSELGIDKADIAFTKGIILKIYNNLNLEYEQ